MSAVIHCGDCIEMLAQIEANSVQTCVTSPPYFNLRDYGVEGQIGLEKSPELYVEKMVEVFRGVRRVLRDDGTLWLNIGDSYAGSGKGRKADGSHASSHGEKQSTNAGSIVGSLGKTQTGAGVKPKDLIGIPWMLAFAMRADGWYLRSDIVWHKPNPMPESVLDRPTRAHEFLFLLTKSARYQYDTDAVRTPLKATSVARLSQPNLENQAGSERANGGAKTNGTMKAVQFGGRKGGGEFGSASRSRSGNDWAQDPAQGANLRDVWSIATKPFKGAHFAVMPEALVEPCIKAGSREGDLVLDPFAGSGTVGAVARRLGRDFVGIELNPEYAEMARRRAEAA